MTNTKIRKHLSLINFKKLSIASIIIGFLSAFLGISLKRLTEYFEEILFHQANTHSIYFVLFPIIGFLIIALLRQTLFKKKENKGIKEIFESTNSKTKNLPKYKIASHFVNGFFTVIFGGSTGIEVSTVVASATIGSLTQQKANLFRKYKTELICAGIAAGITALFSSPVAGILFAYEVISKKVGLPFILSTGIAVLIASGLSFLLEETPLFAINNISWHLYAIPYFILLGILSGLNGVYLTKSVLFFKTQFSKIESHYYKISIGVLILSSSLLLFPELYGDGYHGIKAILYSTKGTSFSIPFVLTLLGILILKPIVTSATLGSGGDGGVFAPSLFIGAFLGLLTSIVLNRYFDANVIPLNFMVLGMAATLSASIHAPFTALFLVCGLTNNYTLFFPILAICLISKYTAKMVYPFTVYSYTPIA